MKAVIIITFLFLISSIYSFYFGQTNVTLSQIQGGTATIKIVTENGGTMNGSSLRITGLMLFCNPNPYSIECISNKQLNLTSREAEISCSINSSLAVNTLCFLVGDPTFYSTNDSFIAFSNSVQTKSSKYGDVEISLLFVEGKNITIQLSPEKNGGETQSDSLTIQNLEINNKLLTCQARGKLNLNSKPHINCTASEELQANLICSLNGKPTIISEGDSFDKITIKKNDNIYSSFGTVKVGIINVQGTTVFIELIPEYEGEIEVDISGLKLNGTKNIYCPTQNIDLTKGGAQHKCTIEDSVKEEDLCLLNDTKLYSEALPKLVINEEKSSCIAQESDFGSVKISLQSVFKKDVIILIKTKFFGKTQSNSLTINGLSLQYDNNEMEMSCKYDYKIDFNENGKNLTCQVNNQVPPGKECKLTGVASISSSGDTFSGITVSSETIFSSFGKIAIKLISIVGKNVKIQLSSEVKGTTTSSITSINNLKIKDRDLNCSIGVNINFASAQDITCTLVEDAEGGIEFELKGNNPLIIKPENSNDIFGEIVLDNSKKFSSFGKLEISLISVAGKNVNIGLKSEYIGELNELTINYLYVNNKDISCKSKSTELRLKNTDGTSNANIECLFVSSYSQETNTTCKLTGNPSANPNLFTSIVITENQVTSGIRDFGETIIYLYSIKGTTVTIQIKPSLDGKVRPIISGLKLKGGSLEYNVECDVDDKFQLYHNDKVSIKCYIKESINEGVYCNLNDKEVSIKSDSGDIFGKIVISTIGIKSGASSFGNTKIKLVSVVGTQLNINIEVSSTTYISYASPVIHGLNIDGSELYCVSSKDIYFYGNTASMSCTSLSLLTCNSNCKLSGTPVVVSSVYEDATFGFQL